jgi:hypothetical protein
MTTLVGALQVADRGPLAWDEAARVDSGMKLAFALRDLDLVGVWDWFTLQDGYYPFLGTGVHGLAHLVTGDALSSAWLPPLIAYGLGGVLVGQLGRALGAGAAAAWIAALLFWLTPIEVKVAAGALSETMGVCVEVGALLLLIRLERTRRLGAAIGLGVVLGLAWWIKYDYGLIATGTVAIVGLLRLAAERKPRSLIPYAAAISLGLALLALAVLPGWRYKNDGFLAFVGKNAPGSPGADFVGGPWSAAGGVDLGYYPNELFAPSLLDLPPLGEVALTSLVGVLFLGGVAWGAAMVRRLPATRPPLVFIVLWLLTYSVAAGKFPRFLATLVPVLAALSAAMAVDAWRRLDRRGPAGRAVAAVAVVALASQLAFQIPRLPDRFGFLTPDPPVSEALAFISPHLPASSSERWMLMIGQTNELGPNAIKIKWSERLGRQAPGVDLVPETEVSKRRRQLLEKLSSQRPVEVVGIDVERGSPLDSPDFRHSWPSQRDYYRTAVELERQGLLRPLARTTTRDGTLRVTLWKLAGNFDRRAREAGVRL